MLSSNNREFIVFAMVCLSVILIAFETIFYGIFIICLWVIFIKAKIMGGQIELDKTVYTLPKIGENIIIKDFLDILIRF
jgi:membrane protein required for beta-lactamase induction